jgi:hypothetical protein
MAAFPNSKIELHQWINSILLGIVGFFVIQTYITIQTDHEKIAGHETRLAVHDEKFKQHKTAINIVTGTVSEMRRLRKKEEAMELENLE